MNPRFFCQMKESAAESFIWAAKMSGMGEDFKIIHTITEIERWDEFSVLNGVIKFKVASGNKPIFTTTNQDLTPVWSLFYLVEGYDVAENGTLNKPQ